MPNPEKGEKRKLIKKFKQELEKLKKEYGEKAFQNDEVLRPTMRGFNIANSGYKEKILKLEKEIGQLTINLKQTPDRIAVKHLLAEHEIVRLEAERKMFTDGVKMVCYRAETCLLSLIAPFFARNNDEGRSFLRNVFQQPADIILDKARRIMNVKFHTMSTPRSNRALKQLCDVMNQESYVYPGTRMMLVFLAE